MKYEQPHHWLITCKNNHPLFLTKDKHISGLVLNANMCIPSKYFNGILEDGTDFNCLKCYSDLIKGRKIKTKTWQRYKEEFKNEK